MANAVVAIAGSSGLIGSALTAALRAADHTVLRIVRRAPANSEELHWNPESGEFDPHALTDVDAVVNLCGVNIAQRRWSGAFKQSLRDSRITPTEVLSAAVADAGVATLINASAVGYYGNTKDRVVDENDSAGTGFLAQLCVDWETATRPAQQSGARVVLARTGVVLSPAGGMLRRMRPLFSVGLGARLGSGRQYMDQPGGRGAGAAVRYRAAQPVRPGELDRAGPRYQRRIHHRVWPRRQPPYPADVA